MPRRSRVIRGNAAWDVIRNLNIRNLEVDETYQRKEREGWTSELASKFEPCLAGVITVNRRKNGKLYIVDGRHRREAALRAGYTSLPAQVYDGLSLRDEARLFLMLNNQRRVTEGQKLQSQIAAGDPDAIALARMIRRAGLVPLYDKCGSRRRYGFRAFSKLKEVIHNNTDRSTGICNKHTVVRILTLLAKTWDGNPESITQRFLLGLDKIVREHGDRFTDEEWISRVGRAKPEDIRRAAYAMARAGRYNWEECFAQAMIDEYNHGLPHSRRIPDYI